MRTGLAGRTGPVETISEFGSALRLLRLAISWSGIPNVSRLHHIDAVRDGLPQHKPLWVFLDQFDVGIVPQPLQRRRGESGRDGAQFIELMMNLTSGLLHQTFGNGFLAFLEDDIDARIFIGLNGHGEKDCGEPETEKV